MVIMDAMKVVRGLIRGGYIFIDDEGDDDQSCSGRRANSEVTLIYQVEEEKNLASLFLIPWY